MKNDLLDKMIAFEQNELHIEDIKILFQELIDSDLIWQLQGFYIRTAKYLVHMGYCKGI